MSNNPRDGDAERLRILRINHPAAHASPTCATCFLLAQIDTRDTDLREKSEEIAFLHSVLEGFSEAIKQRDILIFEDDTAEVEIERLKPEIAHLRSASAERVVEEARKLKFEVYQAHGSGFVWTLVEGDPGNLSTALAEYDAADDGERSLILTEEETIVPEAFVDAVRRHVASYEPGTLIGSELNLAIHLHDRDGDIWEPWCVPGTVEYDAELPDAKK